MSSVRQEAAKKIMQLYQGQDSVAVYAITFRNMDAECGWNEQAPVLVFHHGLSDSLGNRLARR